MIGLLCHAACVAFAVCDLPEASSQAQQDVALFQQEEEVIPSVGSGLQTMKMSAIAL